MNHFFIGYAGNKRTEYKYLKFNFDNVKTIIEPFCGTSAISYNIYKEHKDKFKYVLNDNNENLMALYKRIKDNTINEFIKEVNDTLLTIKNKEDYTKLVNNKKQNPIEWFIRNKYYNIRPGLYDNEMHDKKYTLSKELLLFIEFVKDPCVEIYSENWDVSFEKYKDDSEALLIFDPPYLALCNDFYINPSINVYEYFFNNKIESFKSKIYFILEDMWIIKMLFVNNKKGIAYDKIYQTGKKKTTHILISNIS